MKEESYFKNIYQILRRKLINEFNFIEKQKLNSIIKEYVKAVEDIKCKKRYYAPKIQYYFAKIIQIFR
ncbi:hypothetical protein D3C81_2204560 [compost metagenome]